MAVAVVAMALILFKVLKGGGGGGGVVVVTAILDLLGVDGRGGSGATMAGAAFRKSWVAMVVEVAVAAVVAV
ncbi:hypothetical protein TorRG33x02_273820, partial [Trema orientale]